MKGMFGLEPPPPTARSATLGFVVVELRCADQPMGALPVRPTLLRILDSSCRRDVSTMSKSKSAICTRVPPRPANPVPHS
eukprot:CAMPEP_0175408602 /NCGR_PEP_ID=MMETSP0095-20121207/40675_1 /TAXON_ID=311494 /ORGANISM="Alexandrium monilatum, Strain CCMP3105" /LENGTH=79 /DNA_ID=CAMNT_0016707521 /DNA_START=131 /DNA_END=367 /DNA_ORIENTATION=+